MSYTQNLLSLIHQIWNAFPKDSSPFSLRPSHSWRKAWSIHPMETILRSRINGGLNKPSLKVQWNISRGEVEGGVNGGMGGGAFCLFWSQRCECIKVCLCTNKVVIKVKVKKCWSNVKTNFSDPKLWPSKLEVEMKY